MLSQSTFTHLEHRQTSLTCLFICGVWRVWGWGPVIWQAVFLIINWETAWYIFIIIFFTLILLLPKHLWILPHLGALLTEWDNGRCAVCPIKFLSIYCDCGICQLNLQSIEFNNVQPFPSWRLLTVALSTFESVSCEIGKIGVWNCAPSLQMTCKSWFS